MKKYHHVYNAIVLNLGRDGASQAQMAARLKTSRQQLRAWASKHPNFARALTVADEMSLAYWEDKAQDYLCRPLGLSRARTRRTRDLIKAKHLKEGHMILSELVRRFPTEYRVHRDAVVAPTVATAAITRVIVRASG